MLKGKCLFYVKNFRFTGVPHEQGIISRWLRVENRYQNVEQSADLFCCRYKFKEYSMVEEIRPNFFRIEIPLPNSPLKFLNSYVIRSFDRSLIVDTGLNRNECLQAMQTGLQKLGIDLTRTDFFITHLHADHFGLVGKLVSDNRKIFFNRPETELIEGWGGWEPMVAYAGINGFPENELRRAIESHPGFKFGSEWIPDISVIKDGDRIEVGDYVFECVSTPGHSMGHMCLYESGQKILIAGDHILDDITPNIQCWSDEQNPLKNYIASLDKVNGMEIDLVLPGHRGVITDHKARIIELKEHHQRRFEEILSILTSGPLSAFQVASKMSWDIDCDSWEKFPLQQKWFATGEAISHLRFLEKEGTIRMDAKDKIRLWRV
jgi:glyoxylase-like metal-dependent hydrolase (beta-lactamase superfamily II)